MDHVPATGVDEAARKMLQSARREASAYQDDRRWVLLSLYAEIHRRAAKLIDDEAATIYPEPASPQRTEEDHEPD